MSTATLETYVELNRTRLETMLKVLDVDGAVRRVRGGWEATGQEWGYDEERYRRVTEAREREQQAMLDYLDTDECRMRFLREQLDDPEAADCGRCDNCGGLDPVRRPLRRGADRGDGAAGPARRPVEPRKMWPTALANLGIDLKGKIAEGASEGRAVARLTDLGHGQSLRALFAPATDDGPVPVPLVKAVIEVLGDWRPRVDAIVVVESATRPTLTADLADGLSRYLKVPVVGRFAIVDPDVEPGPGRDELRAAGGCGRSTVRAPGRRGRAEGLRGAAGRRPGRHRLDADPGRPGDPGGRGRRGGAARARRQRVRCG